jgi:hypothetical protein
MRSFDSSVAPPILIAPPPKSESSLPADRDALVQRVAHVEGYMTMSKRHVASQRTFAAELLRDGHDATQALACSCDSKSWSSCISPIALGCVKSWATSRSRAGNL